MERGIQTSEWVAAAGASEEEVRELLQYDSVRFKAPSAVPVLPLADEPFVECWSAWVEEAVTAGAFAVLRKYLPQLRFPIRAGISKSDAYRAATWRGEPPGEMPEASGLELERPESIEIELHASLAGRVPVIYVRHWPDFATLVQALAKRNEPVPIPGAQGASMVSGFTNAHRLRRLQQQWEAQDPATRSTATWKEEMVRIMPHRSSYQDRFILLSNGPYSAVPAADLGLDEAQWSELSLRIRREHECTHYFTRRFYGAMRNHLLDELIADYAGLVAALGRYRADWFLHFIGLEDFPRYREGARLDIYRGDPPLSDAAFRVLGSMACRAAVNVEAFDHRWPEGSRSVEDRAMAIRALASLSLLEIASPDAVERLEDFCRYGSSSWRTSGPPRTRTSAC